MQADSIYCVERYFAIGTQAYAARDYRLAVKMFREACRLLPKVEHLMGLAESLAQLDEIAEAAAAFENALKLDPRCAKALSSMGVMYEKRSMIEQAYDAYARSLKITPDALTANNFANCNRWMLKLDQAEYWYRKAYEWGYPNAQLNLSLLLMLKGDYVQALPLFETRDKLAADEAYGPAREMLKMLDEAGRKTT